jgi:hypothetical protein
MVIEVFSLRPLRKSLRPLQLNFSNHLRHLRSFNFFCEPCVSLCALCG